MREEKSMDEIERRAFVKGAAIGALAFTVGGAEVMLTPRQARAQGAALRTLTADQAATLEAMGETLVPGAKDAGITYFFRGSANLDPAARGPARSADHECEAAVCEFLPRRARCDRWRQLGALWRPQFCAACRQRATRVCRSNAAKQAGWLERPRRQLCVFPAA